MNLLLAVLAGAAGGLGHLGLVALRARMIVRGRPFLGQMIGPVSWLFPLGAASLVIALDPPSAWAVLPGLIAARTLVLATMVRKPAEKAET